MKKRNVVDVELDEEELKVAVSEYLGRKGIECKPKDVCFEQKLMEDYSSCIAKEISITYCCNARGVESEIQLVHFAETMLKPLEGK